MWSALPLWIFLNVYAFLLDILALSAGGAAWYLFAHGYTVLGWAATTLAVGFATAAISVHASYPQKLRTYEVLLRRNREELHPRSFYEFMGAPCYRLVVRAVLKELGHADRYRGIFRACWGDGFSWCSPMPAEITIFRNREEARRWLREQDQ